MTPIKIRIVLQPRANTKKGNIRQNCFEVQRSSIVNSYCVIGLKYFKINSDNQQVHKAFIPFSQMPQFLVSFDLILVNLLHHLVFSTSNILHKPVRKNESIKTITLSRNMNTLLKPCPENTKTSNSELGGGGEEVPDISLFMASAEGTLPHLLIQHRKASDQPSFVSLTCRLEA